jgi:hypothetical protein
MVTLGKTYNKQVLITNNNQQRLVNKGYIAKNQFKPAIACPFFMTSSLKLLLKSSLKLRQFKTALEEQFETEVV